MHANQGHTPSLQLIGEAISKGILFETFIGLIGKTYSQYASLPTDDEFIFNSWLLYIENQPLPHDHYWQLFKKTIVRISEHEELSWFSIYYLFSWLSHCKRINTYPPDMQGIIDKILANVYKFKTDLEQSFKWTADERNNFSLWSDFVRMSKIMADRFPFTFRIPNANG